MTRTELCSIALILGRGAEATIKSSTRTPGMRAASLFDVRRCLADVETYSDTASVAELAAAIRTTVGHTPEPRLDAALRALRAVRTALETDAAELPSEVRGYAAIAAPDAADALRSILG